jgi:putative flippase GtrA
MGAKHQPLTFAVIGALSTAAHLLLYALFRQDMAPHVANGLALLVTAVLNTQANRRLTFGIRGTRDLLTDHVAGLGAYGLALAITSGALSLLLIADPRAGVVLETSALIGGSVVATLSRFFLLRWWMTRHRYIVLARTTTSEGRAPELIP